MPTECGLLIGKRHYFLCSFLKVIVRKELQTTLCNYFLSLFLICSPDPHNYWYRHFKFLKGKQDTTSNHVTQCQPTKYVDKNGLDSLVLQYQLEATLDRFRGCLPTSIQKVCSIASMCCKRVHCVHSKSSTIDQSPYRAFRSLKL